MMTMDIDREGIGSFCLMAHGNLIPKTGDNICQLKNTIVIMNSKPDFQFCDLQTLGNAWYNASSNIYGMVRRGEVTDALLSAYVDLIQRMDTFNEDNKMSVFFETCPNLILKLEDQEWRDGLWQLPMYGITLRQLFSIQNAQEDRQTKDADLFLKPDQEMYEFFREHRTLKDVITFIESTSVNIINVIMVHACTTPVKNGDTDSYEKCKQKVDLSDTLRLTRRIKSMLQPVMPGHIYLFNKYRRVKTVRGKPCVYYDYEWIPVCDLIRVH